MPAPIGETLGVSIIPPLVFPVVNLHRVYISYIAREIFFFWGGRVDPVIFLGLLILALFFLSYLEN